MENLEEQIRKFRSIVDTRKNEHIANENKLAPKIDNAIILGTEAMAWLRDYESQMYDTVRDALAVDNYGGGLSIYSPKPDCNGMCYWKLVLCPELKVFSYDKFTRCGPFDLTNKGTSDVIVHPNRKQTLYLGLEVETYGMEGFQERVIRFTGHNLRDLKRKGREDFSTFLKSKGVLNSPYNIR
ncbi:hypothetical protein HN385_00075 [archaeon]|jgi:hypothetical protein|nr:hypothetical protein [archaeon]MBT3450846.1 hypothetical protein [archaeon]MBT6869023.1 hypothetical protein [archaeon]MBT7193611.1 hypothetical protein [archaeon]MBT7380144.1 hypothetical protein [archaeon]